MKLWRLPAGVANTLIASGALMATVSIVAMPSLESKSGEAEPLLRAYAAVFGIALGTGMILNGILRSTRPPEDLK